MKTWVYIAALLLMVGCASEEAPPRPSHILSEDTMSIVLAEVHYFNAAAQHRDVRRKFMQSLVKEDMDAFYDSLGVTEEQFDESLQYYLDRPQEMLELYDGAMDLLSTRLASSRPTTADSPREEAKPKPASPKELMKDDPNIFKQQKKEAQKQAEAKGS